MPDLTHLPLFLLASAVLLLTPGPAVLYIIARSVDQGRRAGLVSVCSIEVGNFHARHRGHAWPSALLLSSALAFTIVKYLGAAYLIYLGLHKLLAREAIQPTISSQPQSLRRIFSQGVVVATLNPKTALFFVAFLPQFVDRSHGSIAGQMLVLGCIFVAMALMSDSMYALVAGTDSGDGLAPCTTFDRPWRLLPGSGRQVCPAGEADAVAVVDPDLATSEHVEHIGVVRMPRGDAGIEGVQLSLRQVAVVVVGPDDGAILRRQHRRALPIAVQLSTW